MFALVVAWLALGQAHTQGWDIRPSERGDWWVLRTNLRIPPQLELDHDDHTWSLQHLEFNFIQLVVYPQRWKRAKDLAKAG